MAKKIPKTGEVKILKFRAYPLDVARLDALCHMEELTRSEMLRRMLASTHDVYVDNGELKEIKK